MLAAPHARVHQCSGRHTDFAKPVIRDAAALLRRCMDKERQVVIVERGADGRRIAANELFVAQNHAFQIDQPGLDLSPDTAAGSGSHSGSRIPAAPPQDRKRSLGEIAALHSTILERLSPSPIAEDQLIRDLNLPSSTVATGLVALELEGRVSRKPGGLVALN